MSKWKWYEKTPYGWDGATSRREWNKLDDYPGPYKCSFLGDHPTDWKEHYVPSKEVLDEIAKPILTKIDKRNFILAGIFVVGIPFIIFIVLVGLL
jgi:hypothetical protein